MILKHYSSTVRYVIGILIFSALLTLVASFIPVGKEWTITGNACYGWCYEEMTTMGLPLIVFHPDGLNSVSWFFSGWAFLANFLLFICMVHTVISLINYGVRLRRKKR